MLGLSFFDVFRRLGQDIRKNENQMAFTFYVCIHICITVCRVKDRVPENKIIVYIVVMSEEEKRFLY
jgi:hypothetical protein